MLRRVVLWTLLAACGASQRSGGEPVDPMERLRAECDGLEHDEQAKCMAQKQLQAVRDHEHEDIQRKQPTADKPCGEDATPSESATDEGNRRHIEFIQCTIQQRMTAQREREAEQQAQEQHERLERARQRRQAERDQRRKRRETAPCTEDNARQALVDDAVDQHETEIEDGKPTSAVFNTHPSDDQVRQQQQQCVETRVAECQGKVDADDLAGAASCWERVHDSVDEGSVNRPDYVKRCLDGVANAVAPVRIATCTSMKERTDDDVVAKADCFEQIRVDVQSTHTCGHLDLSKYVEHRADIAMIDAQERKLKPRVDAIIARREKVAAAEAERKARKEAADKKERERCGGNTIIQVVLAIHLGRVDPDQLRSCHYAVGYAQVETTTRDGWMIVSVGAGGASGDAALQSRKRHADGSFLRDGTATFAGLQVFNRVDGGTATIPAFRFFE